MKANKIVAFALATLALVACKKTEPAADLSLSATSLAINVGDEQELSANIACTFEADNKAVVALTPATDGKSVKVKGLAEGTAIISATAAGASKTCVVKVSKGGGGHGGKEIVASQLWPIVMDGVTYEANESKVVASFQPNDVDQYLYVWDDTYAGGEAQGMNSMGNTEGYTSLVVTSAGWSGAGYNLNEGCEGMTALRDLRTAILANPDQYFLHMAIKSTDQAEHTFYFFNTDATTFVLGPSDFKRDGAWYEFNIPMSQYAAAIDKADLSKGANIFVMLSGGVTGTVLNLDAVYFYKK